MKNNVFTNPEGWAKVMVRKKSSYILWIIATLMWSLYIISVLLDNNIKGYSIYIITVVATSILPLAYLRALRSLCKENLN